MAQLRDPIQPQRRRGRERVAAIVEAAVDLFATREYSAVTMTEIAARSHTAIGSLYRFFPTKDHVADEILARYGQIALSEFEDCAAQAGARSIEDTAADLVERVTSLGRYRAAGLALIEARSDRNEPINDHIHRIRGAMRAGIGRVLATIAPDRSDAEISARALAVLQVLKTAASYTAQARGEHDIVLRELRRMLVLYLSDPD